MLVGHLLFFFDLYLVHTNINVHSVPIVVKFGKHLQACKLEGKTVLILLTFIRLVAF